MGVERKQENEKFRTVVSILVMALAGVSGFFVGSWLDEGRAAPFYFPCFPELPASSILIDNRGPSEE